MTRKTLEIITFLAGLGLSTGCVGPDATTQDRPRDEPSGARTEALGEVAPEPAPGMLQGDVMLDRRDDGARLVGRPEPLLANTDHERVMSLRVLGDAARVGSLDGARILEARFVGDAIVTIGADHVLRIHAASGTTELDSHAYGPLSVAGTTLAYVRGEAPLLELARADVRSGTVATLTEGMAPVWSPALTPDGRAIVFVSGAQGTPRLFRVDGDGTPRALPTLERFPSAPVAPRFEGELFVFEDHLGTAWVDLEQGRIVRTAGVQ